MPKNDIFGGVILVYYIILKYCNNIFAGHDDIPTRVKRKIVEKNLELIRLGLCFIKVLSVKHL
jgi:hypothetical protein